MKRSVVATKGLFTDLPMCVRQVRARLAPPECETCGMSKGVWRVQSESGTAARPFDAAKVSWVTVSAAEFFFEPYCAEFKPMGSGSLVVVCGDNDTRQRGVEVAFFAGGRASVWVPPGGRVFWLPERGDDDEPNEPWETRLREFDHVSGTPVTG